MWILRSAFAVVLLVAVVRVAPLAAGEAEEANMEILLSTLRANKKAFVAVNLGLDDSEAKAFWPAYDQYQAELTAAQEQLVALIEDYSDNFATLSDEAGIQLVERFLEIEDERNEIRRRHVKSFAAILPGKKVARLYQIENKIEALFRYEMAATIPVVE